MGLTGLTGLIGGLACSAGGASAPPSGAAGYVAGIGGYFASAGGATTADTGGTVGAAGGADPGAGGEDPGAGGATAGSGGATPDGAGGQQPYDPSVTFDWKETVPTAGSCKPGKYSGTFDGLYTSPAAANFPVPVSGAVDLTLEQSQDGEFFRLANGKMKGLVYGFIPFASDLTGTLDCTSLKLVDGFMPKGTYNVFGVDYPYEGPLDADYDKLTNAFVNGQWQVGEPTYHRGDPLPVNGGKGTWTVVWKSP